MTNINKKLIMATLIENGYELQLKNGTKTSYYYKETIGQFNIYIDLSNRAKVIIETSGTGNYFIKLSQWTLSYSEATASDLILVFTNYRAVCNAFNTLIITDDDRNLKNRTNE